MGIGVSVYQLSPLSADIHHSHFCCHLTIESTKAGLPTTPMAIPPNENTPRNQPTRLVFVGFFQLWEKPRLPPDIASGVAQVSKLPPNSGGELIVPNRPVVAGHAADLAGIEVREG